MTGSRTDSTPAALTSIEVTPATASLTTGASPATQTFTAIGHYADGHTADVSKQVSWSLADPGLGAIDATGQFTSTTDRGGQTDVVAAADASIAGKAKVVLGWSVARVSTDDGSTAPADSATKFGGGAEATLAPKIVYPLDGTFLPQNLGELEVQWQPQGSADLFEVGFTAPNLDLRVYTNAAKPRALLLTKEWSALAATANGARVTVSVRAVKAASPAGVGTAPPVQLTVGRDPVMGGIYYWASTGSGASAEGINRHQFGDTMGLAQPFYTESDGDALLGGSGHCVACHTLSRDGTKCAVTFNAGGGTSALLDVAKRSPLVAPAPQYWNFASFNPDGTKIVGVAAGKLNIIDAAAKPGAVLATIATGSAWGTHPDWSADGKSIVYTEETATTGNTDWNFSGSSLAVTTDSGTGFQPRQLIVTSAGETNYYPTFSPDGKWILFNRSHINAYNAADAEVYVVSADGKVGPIKLAAANGAVNLTNSWPRWSPFVQKNGPNGDLFYFTFSSKRDYGNEIAGAARPQVWMSAFDPSVAMTGGDPSFTPFWLPFQDPGSSNHIAQWTTTIVTID
jgi:Tol biopolymer transport system component